MIKYYFTIFCQYSLQHAS